MIRMIISAAFDAAHRRKGAPHPEGFDKVPNCCHPKLEIIATKPTQNAYSHSHTLGWIASRLPLAICSGARAKF